MTGIIIKALSGFFYVLSGDNVYECRARGNFRKSGKTPLVGDYAEISALDTSHGIIEEIRTRKSCLLRPPVANIEKLFIISSHSSPKPNTSIIDRMAAIAIYNGIEPVIVFNKCDMGDFSEFEKIYRNSSFKTYVVSAKTGEGISDLNSELTGCISAFTGNSGVGKSSLLNKLFGINTLTGEVSEKLGRGRHTTRHTELIPTNCGGYVADTPGFSWVEYSDSDYDFKEHLAECFPDFSEFTDNCRFSSCTHTCEAGCGVLKAVQDGKIEKSRHNSYMELFEELKQIKPWEAVKKNRK